MRRAVDRAANPSQNIPLPSVAVSDSQRPAAERNADGIETDPRALIEDIDIRQSDLLTRLADLNTRVESLMKEWLAAREQNLDSTSSQR